MDVSSVASAMTSLRAAETAAAIQYAVAAKMMQSQSAHAAAVMQMVEAAGQSLNEAVAQSSAAVTPGLDVLA